MYLAWWRLIARTSALRSAGKIAQQEERGVAAHVLSYCSPGWFVRPTAPRWTDFSPAAHSSISGNDSIHRLVTSEAPAPGLGNQHSPLPVWPYS